MSIVHTDFEKLFDSVDYIVTNKLNNKSEYCNPSQ